MWQHGSQSLWLTARQKLNAIQLLSRDNMRQATMIGHRAATLSRPVYRNHVESIIDKRIKTKIIKGTLILYLNNQARTIRKQIINKLHTVNWTVKMPKNQKESNYANSKAYFLRVWHEPFGHINFQTVKELAKT